MDTASGPSCGPAETTTGARAAVVLRLHALQTLIDLLRAGGWAVIGPTVRDGVVTHAEITGTGDLPVGVGDEQEAAHYRLRARDDGAVFGYTVPAASWKAVLFPAREMIRGTPDPAAGQRPPALFGVRSCDLHA